MEAGLFSEPDSLQLAHAIDERRVLVTRDRDFAELHWQNQEHFGIVVLTGSDRISTVINAIELVYLVYTANEMIGRLEWVK
jgi:predicted nuclease of predicted toxin-antitoxin system